MSTLRSALLSAHCRPLTTLPHPWVCAIGIQYQLHNKLYDNRTTNYTPQWSRSPPYAGLHTSDSLCPAAIRQLQASLAVSGKDSGHSLGRAREPTPHPMWQHRITMLITTPTMTAMASASQWVAEIVWRCPLMLMSPQLGPAVRQPLFGGQPHTMSQAGPSPQARQTWGDPGPRAVLRRLPGCRPRTALSGFLRRYQIGGRCHAIAEPPL